MDELQKRFGRRIKELRGVRGLSQEELAFQTGIHRTYLAGIERGIRNPCLKNIAAISEGLGVALYELFTFSNEDSDQ